MFALIKRVKAQLNETVQVSKEVFEEASSGWLSLNLPLFPHERSGFTFYVSNAAILKHLQMSSKTPAIMAVQPADKTRPMMIIMNRAFETLVPIQYQEAFLAHEQGHIELEHLKQKHYNSHPMVVIAKRAFGHKDMLIDEFEADAYSTKQGYDIIGGLQWMLKNIPHINRKEIKLRIERLTMLSA